MKSGVESLKKTWAANKHLLTIKHGQQTRKVDIGPVLYCIQKGCHRSDFILESKVDADRISVSIHPFKFANNKY